MSLAGKKLLLLVSEDWYFCSHRLPLGRAACEAGAEVVVAARESDRRAEIEAAGLRLAPITLSRSSINPLADLGSLIQLYRLYRRERPDIVHHVALKPTLYGAFVAWATGVPTVVNALGGMGYMFIADGPLTRLARFIIANAFRLLMNRRNSVTILQNPDDIALYRDRVGIRRDHLAMIRGSGVDLDVYRPAPEPPGPPVAVCVSRLLRDKGIGELVEAARILRSRGVALTVRLVGGTDENPASYPQSQIDAWAAEGVVDLAGPSDDVAGQYRNSHIAVLPSYREGLPKSLLEAAACGRPMVATDVPGCREICRQDETGLLVPARQAQPLADALQRLAEDKGLRQRLGARAREVAENEFDDRLVVEQTLALYQRLSRSAGDEP